MKNTVKIIIAGTTGSGKSTLLQIINNALANKGIKAEIIDNLHKDQIVAKTYQNRRLSRIKKRALKITIEERCTYEGALVK